jgi:hypothetical protein
MMPVSALIPPPQSVKSVKKNVRTAQLFSVTVTVFSTVILSDG